MSIKAILFDKDGTLIDLDGTWVPIYKEFLAREKAEGHEHSIELMRQAGYDPDTERFLPNTILSSGTTKQLVQLWWPELDDDGINHKIATLDRDYSGIALANIQPILPLAPFITKLKGMGLKVGVGTNDTYLSAVNQLTHLGIADSFDLILGADSVAVPKPSGDMIRRFAQSLELPTSAIAMVGDNHHDLDEARAGGAGLAIGVLSGSGLREDLAPRADHVIGSIAELPALLGG